ncbi:MAG: alpha-L-rhamnosidase N-terminal domain-containing protein, partial [Opitutae bacterium]|nr:alpha-L-rhamnosidase N-terminal domain-containing protein [Opitutae bacterium]
MNPYDLRVENLIEPAAVPTASPRFSWKLPSEPDPAATQSAYQLQLATTAELLKKNAPDLWDSGRIPSERTWIVAYGGPSLRAGGTYYWRVRLWTKSERSSHWSPTARFGVGLLEEKDWCAHWISHTTDDGTPAGRTCHVQPLKEEDLDPWRKVPAVRRASMCARGSFEIAGPIAEAKVHICGLGHYRLWCNGREIGQDVLQPAWSDYDRRCYVNTYDLSSALQPGRNVLAVLLGNGFYNVVGGTGRYAKLLVSFGAPKLRLQAQVQTTVGKTAVLATDRSWKFAPSAITF